VFGAIRRRTGGEIGHLIEELGEIFNAVTFIVFGAVLLGPVLGDVTWSVALYAVLSLTVVRMIPVAISMIGTGGAGRPWPFSAGSGRVGLPRSSSRCWYSRRADCHTMV
jgi:sodium/hydrogen antiporter